MSYILELRKLVGTAPLIAVGAGAVLINPENRILFQKRADNGCWGLIGGMMELGESIEETARREVLEEVGIELDDIDFFKVYSGKDVYYKYPNGDEVFNVINVFIARGDFTEVQIDNYEVKEARFFAIDEIPENISPPDKSIVKDIIELINT